MSDLRNKLIRLAHKNPKLRGDLLPLVKVALTIGGKKLLKKQRDEGKVYPLDRSPFQLSTHSIFKTQLRYYLQFLSKNLLLGDTSNWKIQPSSIYVEYFIDNRGLVMRLNDPNNKLRAKNTETGVYRLVNNSDYQHVAPSLKKITYGYHHGDRAWYPATMINGQRIYTHGPHKGEVNRLNRNDGTHMPTFAQIPKRSPVGVWIPKGKVSLFLLQPNQSEYVVSSLVNVGKSKTIQELFLGANANQEQRMTKAELRTLIAEKFDSFSGLKRTRRNLWDFKSFNLGGIHIMGFAGDTRPLYHDNTVGVFIETERSEEYDLREPHDEEESGVRWDETDEYYEFHAGIRELQDYVEKMLERLFPDRQIREGYSDGDDFRHFIYEISL